MNTELIKSIKAREYGDIRSILDEHYWPASEGEYSAIMLQLVKLAPECRFGYRHDMGWFYEEV